MNEVRTLKGADTWGSTPAKIAKLIQDRCLSTGRADVTVERGRGEKKRAGRFYLAALDSGWDSLTPSSLARLEDDDDWTKGPAATAHPELAILRGLVQVTGGFWQAHWVVQTNIGNKIQVMDPDNGLIEPVPYFRWWMNGNRTAVAATPIKWESNGLDVEIREKLP
jgi:hypothetical protein